MASYNNRILRLTALRIRMAKKRLADQLRADSLAYQGLSDQTTIDQFIELEMRAYRLDLAFHESAVLLGDATESDRPGMPPLLWRAMELDSQHTPKAVYAAQLLMKTMENRELKQDLERLEAEKAALQAILDGLNPQRRLRGN